MRFITTHTQRALSKQRQVPNGVKRKTQRKAGLLLLDAAHLPVVVFFPPVLTFCSSRVLLDLFIVFIPALSSTLSQRSREGGIY